MAKFDYDLIVIGGGSAGISSAILGMKLGKKVALVEKNRIGGDCTWYGCVPSKALIKVSEVAHKTTHLYDYGLRLNASVKPDTSQVMNHVRSIREQVYQEETPEVFEKMGIAVFIGPPEFLDAYQLKIGDKTVSAKKFIIATGSGPVVPSIEGIENIPYLTNETLFDLEELPGSMIILGGGPIGSEMASALNRLGVNITQIEKGERILPREDPELVEILTQRFKQEGINLLTGSQAIRLEKGEDKIVVTIKNPRNENREIAADKILIAVGRKPNIQGLNLEAAGVQYDARGIRTNQHLRTSAKNIYACGDVIGSYQFSHIAEYHASVAVPNAVLPLPVKRKINYENIVWATFTDPEFAHAGLTEAEAREKFGDRIKVYRFPYEKIDRAKTDLAMTGMSKFICDRRGRLLGIHIIGERAADILHEAQLAKSLGVPFHKIQSIIHIYPTYGDAVKRPAVTAYADKLQNNFFIKLLRAVKK